jgi:hypothetical protein
MKKIYITGKNNIDSFKSKENKIKLKSLDREFDIVEQNNIINVLFKQSTESTEHIKINTLKSQPDIIDFSIKEIQNKINNYKQQDIKKKIFNNELIIKYSQVINKLYKSNLICCYCSVNIKIVYRISRDSTQWTLDRINNDICHSDVNTIIACLKCNIQRKLIDKDKFEFTKKIKLIKTNN